MIADRTTTVGRRREGGAAAASAASPTSPPASPRAAVLSPDNIATAPATGRPGAAAGTARRPMAHRGPRVVRRAREMRDRSPMLFALLVASFAVTLLCLYVTAYAGVNADRQTLSDLKAESRELEKQERLLSAEVARLTQPNIILERARALGLIPAPPEAQHLLLQNPPAAAVGSAAPAAAVGSAAPAAAAAGQGE